MELKLNVSIGATLQVKNAKGEWVKPEVGAEVLLSQHDLKHDDDNNSMLQGVFAQLWDEVVGPQFATVVHDLIAEQVPAVEPIAETTEENSDEKPNTDEDDYY